MIVIYYHHKVEGWISIYKIIMIFIVSVITLVAKIILQKVIKQINSVNVTKEWTNWYLCKTAFNPF